MSAINELRKDNIKLPSPPVIAIRILEAVKNDASYDELARIISSDPSLAAKTLRMANSSFYGLPQKVDNLEKALAILGFNAMKNIALSFAIAHELRSHPTSGFDFDFFWKWSVTAAVAADLAANRIGNKNDDAFVTGLLQDIGVSLMYFSRKDDYLKVLEERTLESMSVEAAEEKFFGFDHQELGSEILKEWGLPESIYAPIRYHHKNIAFPSEYELRIDTIFLSDKISSFYHRSHGPEKMEEIKNIFENKYGNKKGETENLIDLVASRSIEILSMFEVDPKHMKPYSQILQEANEELAKLNLTSEQLIIKYREAKDRAETLAGRLKTANDKLRTVALRDGLTGLYNHRYFQEILDKELRRAMRYGRPFSLIMFDLDHFKAVNDSYGHRVGDIVLQEISALVLNLVRANDIVARYGGDEFAIISPETDLENTAVFAQRIRKSVEQMKIQANSVTVRETISIGTATYIPGKKDISKTQLLDAADSAMYKAKNTGKNKLCMVGVGTD